jgi:thiosulfate/3-mercaptopyruvate sulfurtransferase
MSPLVTTIWLAARLSDPNTVILDATLAPPGATPPPAPYARYLAQHLPGALFFDIEALSDPTTFLPHMLPTPEAFARAMSALGVSDTMTIVLYEQQGVFSAPRARWMLRTLGAQNVYILDGGLPAWLNDDYPTESGLVPRAPTTFHATLDPSAVVDFPALQQLLAQNVQIPRPQILDARSAARFSGAAPEPRPNLPSGHMPGATSLPFTELLDAGKFKSTIALDELFLAKGIDITQPITTTCGSGVTAAVLALGLELVGAPHINLYDGSWAEYAQHPNATILTD